MQEFMAMIYIIIALLTELLLYHSSIGKNGQVNTSLLVMVVAMNTKGQKMNKDTKPVVTAIDLIGWE
jgi:hypothetical protein